MSTKHTINIRGEIIDLSSPKVMGIINVTPDSFFVGSRKQALDEVLRSAEEMLTRGANFLDVGGYSSRPSAEDIPLEEEIARVVNPIKEIMKRFPNAIISVDTFRSEVARKAVDAGAAIVNDISAGHLDEKMLASVAEMQVPYIAMHMRGTPQTMRLQTHYEDILVDVIKYFSTVLNHCNHLGIKDVLIDPGFGFAKTAEQSFDLLNKLDHFHHLNRPLLVGVSRKSMIYRTLNLTAEEALNGTSVLNTVALFKGAAILRVHDVNEAVQAIKLINQLN
ncbi:dihydropteroate synthase [Ekhidna sp. To15]|uniref:dihydropteroate synthase n=1 Tax=Ekhidna sp. To15 TaxID=3395267 RepID=UPI003F5233FA